MRRCHENQGFQGIEGYQDPKNQRWIQKQPKPTINKHPTARKPSCSSIATCHVQVPLPRAYHYVPVFMLLYSIPMCMQMQPVSLSGHVDVLIRPSRKKPFQLRAQPSCVFPLCQEPVLKNNGKNVACLSDPQLKNQECKHAQPRLCG